MFLILVLLYHLFDITYRILTPSTLLRGTLFFYIEFLSLFYMRFLFLFSYALLIDTTKKYFIFFIYNFLSLFYKRFLFLFSYTETQRHY